MKYAFIQHQRPDHSLGTLCRVLRVSRSGYYDWLTRGPSKREQADQVLLEHNRRVHHVHRANNGAFKTWKVLRQQGIAGGKHRIARLRNEHHIMSKRRKRYIKTARCKYTTWQAPNLLRRNFRIDQPNRVWVADVTHIPTREGWLFLAILIDLYSRKVVGWSMHKRNNTDLLLWALEMAITQRRPLPGLIHHNDQGRTYAGNVYQQRIADAQITPSMSRRGNCWDNAVAESFFATLEFELIDQRVFESRKLARTEIFEFIEVFYNRQRAHQTLEYKTPLRVEQEYQMVA